MTALKYHTGFALSGGFIRGIAHLGMLQALFENNIRPDILSGTSAGAIASAYHFMFEANTLSELSQADLVIAPDGLENFANYQLDKTEDIFSLGYFAALKAIEEQTELRNLKNYNKEILV